MLYFKSDESITVYLNDGNIAVWESTHPDFNKVVKASTDANWIQIQALHNINKAILQNEVHVSDSVVIKNESGELELDSSNKLVQFIQLLKQKGVIDTEIEHIRQFLINMFENPYIDAVTEIYDYCTALDFEITEDGCFLAYKNVNEDLGSIYNNGKTKHIIGEYTEETSFNTDRNVHCSRGLHFCSKGYLTKYSGDTTIIVKVNPADVVAIPTDYNFEKGRCCKYFTVGILEKGKTISETNIEDMTDNKIKTVKASPNKSNNKIPERTLETHNLMNKYDDVLTVANIMGISVETVKRNCRRYKQLTSQ